MKQGTVLNKLVMLIMLATIIIYLIASALRGLNDPFSTVQSYAYRVDDMVEATGFLVRSEQVLPAQSGIVELLPQEGEKVAKHGTVALVYQSAEALERKQTLQSLLLERSQLRRSLEQADAVRDLSSLNRAVLDAMAQLRASTAADDFTDLEREATQLKTLVYRRDYTYGSAKEAGSLESALADTESRIKALNAQSGQDTTRISAPCSGLFSGQVDGYETLLTPEKLDTMGPADLDALTRDKPAGDPSSTGKLITDSRWYFVCTLPQEEAQRLYEGESISVRFSHDWSGTVEMEVSRLGEPEGGRVVVVLTSDRSLSNITLLRRQTVELIHGSHSGIRVPKEALRVEQRQVKDPETGESVEQTVNTVYALVGNQAESKPVNVILQGEDYCLVQPIPGQTPKEARKDLRPGDLIIITAQDLFDGMVIR